MTITPQTERERRSRRLKGLVAGAAGIALLLGGSTFAMWSDSATGTAKDVNHGTLDLTGGDVTAFDLRATGSDKAVSKDNVKKIDLDEFLAVPGDELEISVPVVIDAKGDNMKFDLTLAVASAVTDADWDVKVAVYKGAAMQGSQIDLTTFTASTPVKLNSAALDGAAGGTNYSVVIIAKLPDTLSGQQRINSKLDLSDFTVAVQQVGLA
ncbi:MAG: alternate-type signal peptide domain-containing protein [Bifidobacteriaceae bacterium]|jgi:alternate signal-mediated exported protein|nr:alternate-type signal peptide domain-containing protein [Bifidobacteriaceae bacterium]